MTSAVNVTASKTDFLANAREAFGEALPDWIEIVAKEATRTSATAVAGRLGYSVAVVSSLVRGKYAGDLGAVEARVRGVYMGEEVACPVLGDIARDYCLAEQRKKHIGTSQTRTALFHACRNGCANSRLKVEGNAA
ncbi:MAG: transcriptional regulator [Methylocystis sp.]